MFPFMVELVLRLRIPRLFPRRALVRFLVRVRLPRPALLLILPLDIFPLLMLPLLILPVLVFWA